MSRIPLGPPKRYVVDAKGKRIGVILSFRQYQQLLEDLHDLAIVAERRDEEPISLEEIEHELARAYHG
jgi:hypothetical protein